MSFQSLSGTSSADFLATSHHQDFCHLSHWNAETHVMTSSVKVSKFRSTCIDVTRDGTKVVVGTESGSFAVVKVTRFASRTSFEELQQAWALFFSSPLPLYLLGLGGLFHQRRSHTSPPSQFFAPFAPLFHYSKQCRIGWSSQLLNGKNGNGPFE